MLKKKQSQPIEEETETHPLEPLQEASLLVNKKGHENTGDLLEALIQQNEKNNPEPVLEATLVQSKKNTKEIVGAVESLTKKLEPQELGDGATFVVKGTKGDKGDQGEKGEKGDLPTEESLIGLIKPLIPAPIPGKDGKHGLDGKNGLDGKDGLNGKDGKNGQDGRDGNPGKDGKDGKSVSAELIKKFEDKVKKANQENLLWLNNGAVKSVSVTGSATIDNTDPQNPIINVTGGGGGGTWGSITGTLSDQTDLQNALNAKVTGNSAITGATKTKITYDSKGLVTAGADATTADIADSSDRRYVTDAQLVIIGNTSGTNTGDNATNSQYSGLATSKEDVANKATDFSTINNTLYPTVQAVNNAINAAVVGLLDYRGSYDASTNLFPATGGSGLVGAVLKGDFWICSVAGTLGGTAVTAGDLIISLVDTPGQTASNWDLISNELGYTPENSANKVTSISGASTDVQYPSAKLLYDQLALKQASDAQLTSLAGLSYTGNALKVIRVNAGETDFELATISGGGLSDGDYGDITVGGTGTTMTIDAGVVTLAKMANMATASVIYRKTAGTGVPEVQTLATLKTDLGLTGTNSGDQTTIVGITGTKAQFDTAVTDGNFLYVGDITQYTDELAQDAIGAMIDTTLEYVDATPLLRRAALTGHITASAGSNTTALGSFTLAQLNTAVSDANIIPEAGGTFTGDISVPDEVYGVGWNGSVEVPTKNAIYDKIETLTGGGVTLGLVLATQRGMSMP